MKLLAERRRLRLRNSLHTAFGQVAERELIAVSLTGADGITGHGEAAPLQAYDGVSMQRVSDALALYAEVLGEADTPSGAERAGEGAGGVALIEACRRADDLPQALAAVDMALWDRAGKRAGRPISELLTDEPAVSVPVSATLTATDRAGAAEQAGRALAEGFECIKLKVGIGDDAGRVAAVRAASSPQMLLRLDANGAWSVEQAVSAIESLAPVGLELVEEPTHGLQAVRQVRERVSTRVAIDETAAEHGALGAGVADAVCLKISRCGGISGLLAAAALVRASDAEVYVGSSLDGPLGIAAGLHAAAALASRGPVPACGLATLDMFEELENPLPAREGRIAPPTGPGLGVEPLS